MMSGIRGKDTKPEMLIRSGLHRLGYRFRLHDRRLPGRPDLVFPGRRAVIEVQGCFWHGHDCRFFRWPGSRKEFWHQKIAANIARDHRNRTKLLEQGWRVAEVWECQLRQKDEASLGRVLQALARFLDSHERTCTIGTPDRVLSANAATSAALKTTHRKRE